VVGTPGSASRLVTVVQRPSVIRVVPHATLTFQLPAP
jgi:hypothetical protein